MAVWPQLLLMTGLGVGVFIVSLALFRRSMSLQYIVKGRVRLRVFRFGWRATYHAHIVQDQKHRWCHEQGQNRGRC